MKIVRAYVCITIHCSLVPMFYLFGRLQVDTNLQLIFGAGRAETPLPVVHGTKPVVDINTNMHILPTLVKEGACGLLVCIRIYIYTNTT